jgi:hypothetical protein
MAKEIGLYAATVVSRFFSSRKSTAGDRPGVRIQPKLLRIEAVPVYPVNRSARFHSLSPCRSKARFVPTPISTDLSRSILGIFPWPRSRRHRLT